MSFIYILLVVLGITSFAYLAKLSAKNGISSFDFTFVMFAAAGVLGYLFAEFNHVEIASYTFELCSISAMAGIGGATAVFVFNKSVTDWSFRLLQRHLQIIVSHPGYFQCYIFQGNAEYHNHCRNIIHINVNRAGLLVKRCLCRGQEQ